MSRGLDIERIRIECALTKKHVRDLASRRLRDDLRAAAHPFARARGLLVGAVCFVVIVLSLSGTAS